MLVSILEREKEKERKERGERERRKGGWKFKLVFRRLKNEQKTCSIDKKF